MTDRHIAERIVGLQDEIYDLHEANSAPVRLQEYQEWENWIADQIRKSTYADMINWNVIHIIEDENAHMAAAAAVTVMKERG